jgi:hypothetical protein
MMGDFGFYGLNNNKRARSDGSFCRIDSTMVLDARIRGVCDSRFVIEVPSRFARAWPSHKAKNMNGLWWLAVCQIVRDATLTYQKRFHIHGFAGML